MNSMQVAFNIVAEYLKKNNFIYFDLSEETKPLQYNEKPAEWYPDNFQIKNALLAYNLVTFELWLVKYDPTFDPNILLYSHAVDYLWVLTTDTELSKINPNDKIRKIELFIKHNIGIITAVESDKENPNNQKLRITVNSKLRYVHPELRIAMFKSINNLITVKEKNQPFWVKGYKNISLAKPRPLENESKLKTNEDNVDQDIDNVQAMLTKKSHKKGTIPIMDADNDEEVEMKETKMKKLKEIGETADSLMEWCKIKFGMPLSNPIQIVDVIQSHKYKCDLDRLRSEIEDFIQKKIPLSECKEFNNVLKLIDSK